MGDETLDQRRQGVAFERMAAQPAGALDHYARALADEMGEVVVADRLEVKGRDRVVQALDQIHVRIEKGAVEIEDDERRASGVKGMSL